METKGRKSKMTSRDQQAAERRQQLLTAAKELFAEQGYHATSIRSINQKIGMADGLIYHYFPNGKLEILQTIVIEGHERRLNSLQEFAQTLSDEMPLREILYQASRRMYEFFMSDPQLMRIQFREQSLLEEAQLGMLAERFKDRIHWLEQLLRHRAEQGELREMDYRLAAFQFISCNMMFMVRELLQVDMIGMDHATFMTQMIDFMLTSWKKE